MFPDFFLGYSTIMLLVFLMFIDSLFRSHHSLILAISSLISLSRSQIEGDEAKILKFSLSEQLEMSFIQRKNIVINFIWFYFIRIFTEEI